MKLLLDTHVFIWLLEMPEKLSPDAATVINQDAVGACGVSDISTWEIVRKASLGKLSLGMSTRSWLHQAATTPGIERVRITPEIAWESCHLPGTFHRDPADQIIVATARVLGLTLVTKDRRLIDYAEVRTVW